MSKKWVAVVSSAVLEMEQLVRHAAVPAIPGEKVPRAIARAAHRLGFSRGRTESYWYRKIKHPPEEEVERARQVAVERTRDAELLKNEYRRARDIMARLETRLAVIDADFHQPTIAALRNMGGQKAGPGDAE